jgi:hypothetical protein
MDMGMQKALRLMCLSAGFFFFALAGCGRDDPPTIAEFHPPKEKAIDEEILVKIEPTPAPAPTPEKPAAPPEPTPAPEPPKEQPKKEAPPPPKPVEPEPKAPASPSIIGTWRVEEMSHNGQSRPMPEGMEMKFTFAADGKLMMTHSGSRMPEAQSVEGTYSISGDQITITMQNEAKTGTFSLEGNDKLTLEIDKAKMTLVRI